MDLNLGHMVVTLETLRMTQIFALMALCGLIGRFTQLLMVTRSTSQPARVFWPFHVL